jgi:hypothetical protein
MEQIQLYGKNEILSYMISTKIKAIVEEDSIADIFCSYIIETLAKMPDGKRLDLVLMYNIKRFLEFFYTEVLHGSMDEINWRENDPNGFYIDAIGERSDEWLAPEPFLDVFDKLLIDYSLRRNEYAQIVYIWINRNGEHIYMDREVVNNE